MNPSDDPFQTEILSASQLAPLLQVSVQTLRRQAALGLVPCQRLGRRLLFSRSVILGWLRAGQEPVVVPSEPTEGVALSEAMEPAPADVLNCLGGDIVDKTVASVAEILSRGTD